MPFGLMNSQDTFQRMMDRILLNVDNVRCYVDDVVIFSKNTEEHAIHLENVFRILENNGLRLKVKKCSLMQPSVELLGHYVDENGVHVDQQKVERVRDAISSTTRKELRSFLGLISYYRRFIPGFEKIARPLNAKTSDNVKFVCSEDIQAAFEEMKVKFTSALFLAYPDYEKPFVLRTDASSKTVDAILAQAYENRRDHPINYASLSLSQAESNYSTFQREALSVVFALKKFAQYLMLNRFKLYTDHQALKYVFNFKDPHGRIERWFTLLPEYDFETCYRGGRDNACTNFLSGPIELMVIDENQPFEANLKAMAHYLHKLSVLDESISITSELKKKARNFLVHGGRLFRRTKYGIRFVPHIEIRESFL